MSPRVRSSRLLQLLGYSALTSGLVISLIFHLTGGVLAGLVWIGFGGEGAGGAKGNGPIGLAVVTDAELAEMVGEGLADSTPSGSDLASDQVSGPALDLADPGGLGDAGLGDLEAASLGDGMGSASDIGDGIGEGMGAGGGGSGAKFFGVEAVGKRFAYIVDISGSMSVGGKIEALRAELSRSISDLTPNSLFFPIPFASEALPLSPKVAWIAASDRNKREAAGQIETLKSNGGTNPATAFVLAFSLKPRPDAIYFMTDGEFDPKVADEVRALNAKSDVRIHCICFVQPDSEQLMKKIAEESGGSYTFVPGPKP